MLESKYSLVVWYCHNLGGFDSDFVINTLLRYNVKITNEDEKPFLVSSIKKKPLKLTISKSFLVKNPYKDLYNNAGKKNKMNNKNKKTDKEFLS